MKRNYVFIGAACLLCLALVAVGPAAALGGWESADGEQKNCQTGCTENPQSQFCHGPRAGPCCQHGIAEETGACDRAREQIHNQTCRA